MLLHVYLKRWFHLVIRINMMYSKGAHRPLRTM